MDEWVRNDENLESNQNLNNVNDIKPLPQQIQGNDAVDPVQRQADINPNTSGIPNQNGFPNAAMNQAPHAQQSFGYNQMDSREAVEDLKTSAFYTERHQKPNTRTWRGMLAPLIIVSLLSSILGGALMGAYFKFFVPEENIPKQTITLGTTNEGNAYQQIEIVNRTDSPITAIAKKVGPSIVGVSTSFNYNDVFFGQQVGGGEGSGIIIRSDGYIVTNNHVIEAAVETGSRNKMIDGAILEIVLPNQPDKRYEAKVVGRDVKSDIAVIKVDLTDLPAVSLGNSDDLLVGEPVVAIGNPAGLEFMGSVTAGIISGLNRSVEIDEGAAMRLIQTDAAINPGNSGGALVNYNGEVIGMNSSKIAGSSYEGIGFSIPVNTFREIAESLINNGYVKGRPQIGVSIDTRYNKEVAESNKAPVGALVSAVTPLSSAYNAGIKTGDVLTKVNGVAIDSYNALEEQKNKYKPGEVIEIEIFRVPEGKEISDGQTITVKVTLGESQG